ncbi:type III secretion system chaperone [Spartinivicinus poritis]|uniref:Type III secretion system chaperone n=1 Tax=Spartinivicinus poritis TaxID=2994640 RepID=A0ABT5U9U5_9GAMM|nr:type III secretion system chaperone [Spartinivicinus sp. A2-2]MDE1462238.1 type III secretion system chaperone [Spartinivicinus sp. A2-2]
MTEKSRVAVQNVTAQLTQWLISAGFAEAADSNDQGIYCFNYDQRWLLNIESVTTIEQLYFYAVLTRLTDVGRQQLAEFLLKQNLLDLATEGYSFALDDDDHVILWHRVTAKEITNAMVFQDSLFHFVDIADRWWHQLQAYSDMSPAQTARSAQSAEPLAIKV